MFEPAEEPTVGPEDLRSTVVARLSSIVVEFPVRRREAGFRRARRVAPGVYRTAGLPPAGSVAEPMGGESPPGGDRSSGGGRSPAAESAPEPGLSTAAVLNGMVPGALSSRDLLDGVAGWEQLISRAQARQGEFVAEFARAGQGRMHRMSRHRGSVSSPRMRSRPGCG